MPDPGSFMWRELHFPRPLDPESAVEGVRAVAADPYSPLVALEARGSSAGVRFVVGTHPTAMDRTVAALGATAVKLAMPRMPVVTARKVVVSNRRRALMANMLPLSAKTILAALNACESGEELVLQVVLGPRLSGLVVPSDATRPVPVRRLLIGGGTAMDTESRTALAKKVAEPGFAAVVRVGVVAGTPARRRDLLLGLLGALRRLEAPNVNIYLANAKPEHVDGAKQPFRWPLRLNVAEVAAVAGLPVGDGDLPGLTSRHPKQLAPVVGPYLPSRDRLVIARATAPGVVAPSDPDSPDSLGEPVLSITQDALLRHLLVTGPTGVGKSVLLENLLVQHVERGGGGVLIEPKGDLVDAVLARIPEHRRGDVIVLDPTDLNGVVGMNPLAGNSSPELRADAVLSVFVQLFGDALGVRSADVLHASLLTLAHHEGTSLVDVQRLLVDAAFRARMVAPVAGDPALGPFWAWYESLSDINRQTVIAPLGNKLRTVLMKRSVRAVIGQANPRLDVVRAAVHQGKILLVPLPVASLGKEGSALLGSLVVAAVWNAARERSSTPVSQRRPVVVCLDEFQQYARLPDIEDALATSRSYGVAWVLAHQFENQLPTTVRDAVRANVRSRVAFQLAHGDATTFAAAAPGTAKPDAADFEALGAFHVYASLFEGNQVRPYASGITYPSRPAVSDPMDLRRESGHRYGRPLAEVEAAFTYTTATAPDDIPATATTPDPAGSAPDVGVGRRSRRSTGRPTGHLDTGSVNPPVTGSEGGVRGNASSPPGPDLPPDPTQADSNGGRS